MRGFPPYINKYMVGSRKNSTYVLLNYWRILFMRRIKVSVDETPYSPRETRRGPYRKARAPKFIDDLEDLNRKPYRSRYVVMRSVAGSGEIVPSKARRQSGEAIKIAERVLEKLFKKEVLVPAGKCIEALSKALGMETEEGIHRRGANGQIYNLRNRLNYMSIRNIDTGESFWVHNDVGKKLLQGAEPEELWP